MNPESLSRTGAAKVGKRLALWPGRPTAQGAAPACRPFVLREQVSVPTIDTFGCARFHPFGNGKPQKRAGPATRERRKPWRRQAPPFGLTRFRHLGMKQKAETLKRESGGRKAKTRGLKKGARNRKLGRVSPGNRLCARGISCLVVWLIWR